MNRFEMLEKIFKDNGDVIVDGKAIWSYIEKRVSENGEHEKVEDALIIDGKNYMVYYYLETKEVYFKDGKEYAEFIEDFDQTATDINLTGVQVCRIDGAKDNHTFSWS